MENETTSYTLQPREYARQIQAAHSLKGTSKEIDKAYNEADKLLCSRQIWLDNLRKES